jgi:ABC-type nitrate/sulfonate/bicarbonate transport system permease component
MSLVYLATPHDLGWHVTTSLPRTLFGLAPACLAAAVLAPSLARAAGAARDESS